VDQAPSYETVYNYQSCFSQINIIIPDAKHIPAQIPSIPIKLQPELNDMTAKNIDKAIINTTRVPVILKKNEEVFMVNYPIF